MHWFILILIIVLILAATLFCLLLFCIRPNGKRLERFAPYEKKMIAHRGLFDNESEAPENSLPAFRLAADGGYGIELDVQMTTDGQLVVFHDGDLKRMCGGTKMLTDCSFEELQQYKLGRSQERIPLLADVLQLIDGRVPLIVEIKSEGNWKKTTELTCRMLDSYKGLYIIESFHPFVVGWVRRNRPDVIRGQLSTDFFAEQVQRDPVSKWMLTHLLLNFESRPDFIAYNFQYADGWGYRLCRKLFKVENVAWTIKSEENVNRAQGIFKVLIFDSFRPGPDRK